VPNGCGTATIAGVAPLPPGAIAAVANKRSEPHIPFAAIVEAGLLRAGEIPVDERKRHAATVRADGTISIGAITGSVHKIGALVKGVPACNGWTFWQFARGGRYQPIDAMRSLARASLRRAAV
jgi:modification methylase